MGKSKGSSTAEAMAKKNVPIKAGISCGVEKRVNKLPLKKKSNEIDDIFSLASPSQEGGEPVAEELKAVAEQIKKAREQKSATVNEHFQTHACIQ